MGSSFLGIGGWEFVILAIVFLVIVGPQRLPEYTRSIVRFVRKARTWVDQSRETVESEMGIAVDDLKKYDPRQYDPRRIIREAWGDTNPVEDLVSDTKAAMAGTGAAAAAKGAKAGGSGGTDTVDDGHTPFDPEST